MLCLDCSINGIKSNCEDCKQILYAETTKEIEGLISKWDELLPIELIEPHKDYNEQVIENGNKCGHDQCDLTWCHLEYTGEIIFFKKPPYNY